MIRLSYEVSLVCVVRSYFEAVTSFVGYADTFPEGKGGDLFRRLCRHLPRRVVTSFVGRADTFPKGEGSDLFRRLRDTFPEGGGRRCPLPSDGDAFCFRLQMSERKVFFDFNNKNQDLQR